MSFFNASKHLDKMPTLLYAVYIQYARYLFEGGAL